MIILDTNVVSEIMKPSPAPAVRDWIRARRGGELYTTSITLAEVRYGIERLPAGRRRDLLKATADDVFAAFEDQILLFDAEAA
ncbi:MAG: PIN domain-containing protein, partial [Pseudonocardiaceae bacterium]